MSSYGLVLLVVHFLKKTKEQGKSIGVNYDNLGILFYNFLVYYGIDFNPKENIVDPSGFYDKDVKADQEIVS